MYNMGYNGIPRGQQGYGVPQGQQGYNQVPKQPKVTKSGVIAWFKQYMGTQDIEMVDDVQQYARHMCMGVDRVWLLPLETYNLQTPEGVIILQYYRCQNCGKVILNRDFM